MELIIFIVLVVIASALSINGFFLDPINPYLILFSAMLFFLTAMSMIAGGLEIPDGTMTVDLNITATTTTGTLTDNTSLPSRFASINNSINLVILLLSLYLMYFSIDEILGNKYGRTKLI